MSQTPKDPRTAAEKACDTACIAGSLKHEGYVPTPEAEAVHQRVGGDSPDSVDNCVLLCRPANRRLRGDLLD